MQCDANDVMRWNIRNMNLSSLFWGYSWADLYISQSMLEAMTCEHPVMLRTSGDCKMRCSQGKTCDVKEALGGALWKACKLHANVCPFSRVFFTGFANIPFVLYGD